jgi:hypothetical protein
MGWAAGARVRTPGLLTERRVKSPHCMCFTAAWIADCVTAGEALAIAPRLAGRVGASVTSAEEMVTAEATTSLSVRPSAGPDALCCVARRRISGLT